MRKLSHFSEFLDSPEILVDLLPKSLVVPNRRSTFNYPLMSQAVRDYFLIPSAEVGVERLFSSARDVCRNSISSPHCGRTANMPGSMHRPLRRPIRM